VDPIAITIGASWTAAGLLIIGLAVPLVQGRIGRNSSYGVRFPQAFRSDDAWYAINRFGGRRMLVWALPVLAAGAVAFFLPLQSHPALTLALGFGPLLFVLIPVLESWHLARSYQPKG
jgi:SdpI/YfhL protein family